MPAKPLAETNTRAQSRASISPATTRQSDRNVTISKEIKNAMQEISAKKDVADGAKAVSQSEIDQLFKK